MNSKNSTAFTTRHLPETRRLPTPDEVQTELARRSLRHFTSQAWKIIEPATDYLHNWHHDAIAEYLEAATRREIKRLIINMPPRYMKSIAVSVMWPTWVWASQPNTRWLFASYASTLATKHNVDRRTIIRDRWYQDRWPLKIADDQDTKGKFLNDYRGHMLATSVGASAVGEGGNYIVVDDPHNPEEAQSDLQRTRGVTFFDQQLVTRLDDKKQDVIVVVMQRLHESDLTGHLLLQDEWEQLRLPAIAEKRQIITVPGTDKVIKDRDAGDVLHPEREGKAELDKQRRAMGSYAFEGQYQQNPSPPEGGILKRKWWRRYRRSIESILQEAHEVITSWDCAFKDTKDASYVVGQVWARIDADKYLLHQVRDHLSFPETINAVVAVAKQYPQARLKIVEDKANGPAVIATLGRKVPGIVAWTPRGSKEARAHACSPQVESGNVYLPDADIATFDVDAFIEECAAFPNATHDDQVDAFSQALLRFEFAQRPQVRARSGGRSK